MDLQNFDEIECMDTLLSRYSNIEYIMNMDFSDGIKLISKANIKIIEDRLFQRWNMEHIFMSENDFISFEDYKNKIFENKSNKTNKLSKEETHEMAKKAIEKAESIRKIHQKGGNKNEVI